MIDVQKDGQDTRFFIRGGFVEINPEKIVVLAEEAIPMEEFDIKVLDQRIKDTQEDLVAAKSDVERHRIAESLEDLRLIRAAF
jgi:F-type H+-transporting ATPase subunit epsilon